MKLLKAFFVFLAGLCSAYLAVAFITWNVSPADWHEATRFLFVWMGVPFSGLAAFGVWNLET